MTYSIEILPSARREWNKLDHDIRRQVAKKLERLCEEPRIPSARLSDMPDCYKIKLRGKGYRIVYRVVDQRLVIIIVAVGKRDASKDDVYAHAKRRMNEAR